MLPSFIADDIYRVTLGSDVAEPLIRLLGQYGLRPDGANGQPRCMCRDDGSSVWMSRMLIDGEALERIALQARLVLMQIDNISARLRAIPALPGSEGDRSRHYASGPVHFGVAA